MKKVVLVLAILSIPHVSSAQGWIRAMWDMNPASEAIQYYQAVMDANPPQTIYSPGPQCSPQQNYCYADFEIPDNLSHVISVVAKNQYGFGPATQASFQFGVPTVPANLRLTNLYPANATGTGFSNIQTPSQVPPPPPPTGFPAPPQAPRVR